MLHPFEISFPVPAWALMSSSYVNMQQLHVQSTSWHGTRQVDNACCVSMQLIITAIVA